MKTKIQSGPLVPASHLAKTMQPASQVYTCNIWIDFNQHLQTKKGFSFYLNIFFIYKHDTSADNVSEHTGVIQVTLLSGAQRTAEFGSSLHLPPVCQHKEWMQKRPSITLAEGNIIFGTTTTSKQCSYSLDLNTHLQFQEKHMSSIMFIKTFHPVSFQLYFVKLRIIGHFSVLAV